MTGELVTCYTSSMTMKRTEKAKHEAAIKGAGDGFTEATFSSPKLYRAALADRGHGRMNTAEYREHRLHRGTVSAEMVQDFRATVRGRQRILGGRRLTGLIPGTKKLK